jgi:transcriptional regulator of acetoin/glycerol metabolism
VKIELENLPRDILEAVKAPAAQAGEPARDGTLRETEIESIARALREAGGNKKLAAKRLGIHYATLYRKMKQYGLG